MMQDKIKAVKGTNFKLFNANSATFLEPADRRQRLFRRHGQFPCRALPGTVFGFKADGSNSHDEELKDLRLYRVFSVAECGFIL